MEVKNPITVNGLLLNPEVEVVAISTANVETMSGAQAIDGATRAVGSLVLLKNQTTQSQNGGWVVNTGAWTRIPDYDTDYTIRNRIVRLALDGTTNKSGSVWTCANSSAITINTTAITYAIVPMTIGTGAGQAAAGNHSHSNYAALAGAAFTGASSIGAALGLRYTYRTATATTAATDLIVVMLGSTASQIETMSTGVALSNNSARVVRYVNRASVGWTVKPASTDTLNGGAVGVGINLPSGYWMDVQNTAANTWVVIGFGKLTSLTASDIPTATRYSSTSSAAGALNIAQLDMQGGNSYLVSINSSTHALTFEITGFQNFVGKTVVNILDAYRGDYEITAEWYAATSRVLVRATGFAASVPYVINVTALDAIAAKPIPIASETGTNLVIRRTPLPYIPNGGTASAYTWNLKSSQNLRIEIIEDATIALASPVDCIENLLSVTISDQYDRVLTLSLAGAVFVYDDTRYSNSIAITIPGLQVSMFRIVASSDGFWIFVESLNDMTTHKNRGVRSGVNLNSLVKSGNYQLSGTGFTNAPAGLSELYATASVCNSGSSYISQQIIAVGWSSGGVWVRTSPDAGITWSAWR